MDTGPLILELVAFGLAWWLGLYLIGRDLSNPQLRFAGLGLVSYALALAFDILGNAAAEPTIIRNLVRWGWPLLFLPALFWFASMLYFLPGDAFIRRRFGGVISKGLLPMALILYLLAGGTEFIITISADGVRPGPGYFLFAASLLLLLLGSYYLLFRAVRGQRIHLSLSLVLVATLFFGLGVGLLLVPFDLLPRWLLVLGIGVDLVMLGFGIAATDALGLGEALLPDFWRSFAYSSFIVLLFAGQVALAMVLSTGVNLAMLALLLATTITAIATQVYADPLQSGLDWLVFARIPRVREARAEARVVASAVPRTREVLDPASLTEEQFVRLTRRALSQMGNIPRLAGSPLTRLPLVDQRLADRDVEDTTLERAAELKALLAESIERLKPRGQADFGTSDEWRHYNALYFPYVVGLKPYSRRVDYGDLDEASQSALKWFQAQVPERTLYNWQNAAALLVARDVLEQAGVGLN
jgi:uncharacterized membrane protein YkvA (DUF1232 family)